MTLRFEDVSLDVRTATRHTGYNAEFLPGLNVIAAPNSWGKSTLVQSLVYGLGLEGAFSASHLSPLGEAMSSVIDLEGQREAVVESSVTITLSNDNGEYLRCRRYSRSLTFESALVQTWTSNTRESLDGVTRRDLYVREGGAATHELGFHRLLEEFIGLALPTVPGFNGDEVKLYLELILPLFYVEQKYGWSGLAPRVPTHYRIRSPYRRAAEYSLGLESLERLKEVDRLKASLARFQEEWTAAARDLDSVLARHGWTLSRPLSDSVQTESGSFRIGTIRDDRFVDASSEIDGMRREATALLNSVPALAGARTAISQEELRLAEAQAGTVAGRLHLQREFAASAAADVESLRERQRGLASDRERLVDVRKLERLGSELHAPSLEHASCPTCAQSLDVMQVATGLVLDVSANLSLLDAEKVTLDRLVSSAARELILAQGAAQAMAADLEDLRTRVRSLKDELAGPSGSPSAAQIERRIVLTERARVADQDLAQAHDYLDRLSGSAVSMARVRDRLGLLRGDGAASGDAAKIARFRGLFSAALLRFGLRSLPVGEITIGTESLLPEHDGFELTFDIRHGLSASDAIRTKWAYYVGLARTLQYSEAANPLGVLIMDEPRQQEAEISSVRALYEELAETATGTQVIVASSAPAGELDDLLRGLPAHRIVGVGSHMFAA